MHYWLPFLGTINSKHHRRFQSSFFSLVHMVGALKLLRPHRGIHPRFDGRLPNGLTRPQSVIYCVLCRQMSLRSERMLEAKQHVPADAGILRLSNRYCAEHNPCDQRSRYWTDRQYKKAFERELALLLIAPSLDMGQVRRRAYERVYIRKPQPKRSPERQRTIKELLAQGLNQSEIARRLGLSQQAVWKVVRGNGWWCTFCDR